MNTDVLFFLSFFNKDERYNEFVVFDDLSAKA